MKVPLIVGAIAASVFTLISCNLIIGAGVGAAFYLITKANYANTK